jgi:diguanylate cyclase (GGDEF)-like protein/PAS domain S-box-containing protein
MDRFADRRFGEFEGLMPELDTSEMDVSYLRNGLLYSSDFESLAFPELRWITDQDGRLVTAGPPGTKLAGADTTDLLDFGWRSLVHPADQRQLFRAASSSDQPLPISVRLRQVDRSWRWHIIKMRRAQAGALAGFWVGIATDDHERHGLVTEAIARSVSESEAHHRWSVELSPQVPWTATPQGEIEEVGPQWFRLTGMPPSSALGRGWITALHPDDILSTLTVWGRCLESGEPVDIAYRIRLVDGGYRWMRARAAPRLDSNGALVRWYGTLEDIHEQTLVQTALAQSEERFRLAVEAAGLGIWDYDAASKTQTWSPMFKSILGLPADVRPTRDLALQLVNPVDRPQLRGMLDAVASRQLPSHFAAELRINRADTGEERWIKSTGWTGASEAGATRRVIVTFQDVTEQHHADQRIRWAASHDPLTGLPNRGLWQEALENTAQHCSSTGSAFGLLLFDVDDLKLTNDTLGHDGGDVLLKMVAQRISAGAPRDAVLGRLGGDEFAMVAPSLGDSEALRACAADITQRLSEPFSYDGRQMESSASIGASRFPDHGEGAVELLKAADLALYAAKAAGRGQTVIFHSQLRADTQRRSSMISMARKAISENLITPYYQPKVDLRTGAVIGFEALLRWHHAVLGLQAPATIEAAFEVPEWAVALTDRMLGLVIGDIRRCLSAGLDPGRLAVNASAADFYHGDFAERVLAQLGEHGVSPCHLEIEVTETVFLGRGADNVKRALTKLSLAGVTIALDDFGTGYASLSHLKQYPVDVLKIDRSFISDIEHDRGDTAIVDAIVNLGTSLELTIVAEGVETPSQAKLLIDRGCRFGQGFLLGRPAPFESLWSVLGHSKPQ